MSDELEIKYRRIRDILPLPGNAKLHDLLDIKDSVRKFGFIDPIGVSADTHHDLDGNGRLQALLEMYAAGEPAPKNIRVKREKVEGKVVPVWYAPTVDLQFDLETESLVALRLNRSAQKGGFDDRAVFEILQQAAAYDRLGETGYDPSVFTTLAERYAAAPSFNGADSPEVAGAMAGAGGAVTAGAGLRVGTGEMQASHVRMVQLFLNSETHPPFLERCTRLIQSGLYKHADGRAVENLTDLIFALVREADENYSS